MTASGDGHVQLQLGAYVLHALAADEEQDVAAHLAVCPSCMAEAAELAQVRRMLDRLNDHSVARLLAAAAPAEVRPAEDPRAEDSPAEASPADAAAARMPGRHREGLSPRGAISALRPPARPEHRRRLRRPSRSVLAAILVALAVGVGIGAWLGGRAPVDIRLAGAQTDTQSGVSVRVTVVSTPAGARVDAVVEGLTVGEPYRLYVTGDRGESQVAAAWTAEDTRHGVGGDVAIPIDRITTVTLFVADAALVTVRLSEP